MLRNFFALAVLFFVLTASQCSKEEKKMINNIADRTWMHSVEEDANGVNVFRPKEYKFPPSRGREGFKINKDGKFTALYPGANDAPQESEGTWKMNGNKMNIELTSGERANRKYVFELVEVKEDMLKVKVMN